MGITCGWRMFPWGRPGIHLLIMTEVISKENNRRLRTSYVSAVLSISLVLFMVGLLGILVMDARKLSTYVREHVQLTVFLQEGMTIEQHRAFERELRNAPFARNVRYVSKEAALDSLVKELGPEATSMLESNPLPASIDIMLQADYASAESMEMISSKLAMNHDYVQDVTYQRSEVDRIGRNFRSLAWGLVAFSAVLLLIAVALINNTIKLSLYSSRFIIKSMQLVGATRSFIRRPFLKRGFVHGLIAGGIASGMLCIVLYFIQTRFPDFGQLADPRSIVFLLCGTIGLGVLLAAASTYFAVNKYLRLKVDELY